MWLGSKLWTEVVMTNNSEGTEVRGVLCSNDEELTKEYMTKIL